MARSGIKHLYAYLKAWIIEPKRYVYRDYIINCQGPCYWELSGLKITPNANGPQVLAPCYEFRGKWILLHPYCVVKFSGTKTVLASTPSEASVHLQQWLDSLPERVVVHRGVSELE